MDFATDAFNPRATFPGSFPPSSLSLMLPPSNSLFNISLAFCFASSETFGFEMALEYVSSPLPLAMRACQWRHTLCSRGLY